MDLSALDDTAFSSRVAIESIKKARINLDRTVVLLRVYVGATRQDEPFRLGIAEAKDELREQGIFLEYEIFTSDYVKTSLRWTVSQLIDWLLLADVHMIPCHVHEGSIGKTDSWNMKNIQSNIRRLRFHPGVPMGKHVECAIFNQDKYLMYVKSHPLSADVLQIPLELNLLENEEHLAKIRAFMKKIKGDAAFDDEERFVLKLPFTSGGQLKGKRVTCKTAQGYEGIVAKLREYLNNTDVMGFIPYVILQPRIRDNTEAKVVCFNGKFICRNPHKEGSGTGRSILGANDEALGAVAEGMIATFKAQHPELIMEQILRVDFFQDSTTGRYILNEMEGFNAQVVGLRSGDGATDAMELVKGYWKEKIILLAHRCQIS